MSTFETADGCRVSVEARDGNVIITGYLPGDPIVLSPAEAQSVVAEGTFKGLWSVAGIVAGELDVSKYLEAFKAALAQIDSESDE